MSNALDHLEHLAIDTRATIAAPTTLAADVRTAIEGRDPSRLAQLLGGRAVMACSVMLPERDEPQQDEEPATPDEEPDRDVA